MIGSSTLQNIFSDTVAKKKQALLHRCAAALHGSEPGRAYHVPGRIEVLGKHTDYAGGRSMVAATEQGLVMLASPRADRNVRIHSVDLAATIEFQMHPDLQPSTGSWANYPMTVARRLARNFGDVRGADIALASDLPPASGLSSSSAVIIAIFLGLADANHLWEREPFMRNIGTIEELGGYLGTIENGQTFGDLAGDRGVGTFGGSQDHTAILGGERDRLKVYKYSPVQLEQTIPFPDDWVFVIASSGVVAEKTGSAMEKYNRASANVSKILDTWRTSTGRKDATLHDALHSYLEAPQDLRLLVRTDVKLMDRIEQFVAESDQIVPQAANAIVERDRGQLATLVRASQHFAEAFLENQTPETMFLARSAMELGAIAASAFGAGFGGSVWALVDVNSAPDFLTRWAQQYELNMPIPAGNPSFFTTHPGAGACRIKD